MENKNITTMRDFELFQKEATYFLDFFGLKDWQVLFEHIEIDSRAHCRFHTQGKQAVLALGKEWEENDPVTAFTIKRSAFHETMELLLADMRSVAMDTQMGWQAKHEALERTSHAIIRRLENVILPIIP